MRVNSKRKIFTSAALRGALNVFTLMLLLAALGAIEGWVLAQQPNLPIIGADPGPVAPTVNRNPLRVLLVGDSLTVGGFGEGMKNYLVRRFGKPNVAVYGACGSSPESWMRSDNDFVTKCGYRENTPQTEILYDFENGHYPQPALTPHLEDLMVIFRPRTVIIQLGTNWMDSMPARIGTGPNTYTQILDRMAEVLRGFDGLNRQIIWVTPPDSAHYSTEVQKSVREVIKAAARRHSFEIIDASTMTRYPPGVGDGIHYPTEQALEWAARTARLLDQMIQ